MAAVAPGSAASLSNESLLTMPLDGEIAVAAGRQPRAVIRSDRGETIVIFYRGTNVRVIDMAVVIDGSLPDEALRLLSIISPSDGGAFVAPLDRPAEMVRDAAMAVRLKLSQGGIRSQVVVPRPRHFGHDDLVLPGHTPEPWPTEPTWKYVQYDH